VRFAYRLAREVRRGRLRWERRGQRRAKAEQAVGEGIIEPPAEGGRAVGIEGQKLGTVRIATGQ